MAKRLSAQERVDRLKGEGLSNAAIGKVIGRSASTVGRIHRGQSSGEKALPALRDFSKAGKRAKTEIIEGKRAVPHKLPPAPQVKRAAPPKPEPPPLKSPLAKAERQIANFFDTDKVVVYINVKGTGKSVTLGAHGGIKVSTILAAPSVGDFLAAQAGDQGYDIDWDDVISIEFEEFY